MISKLIQQAIESRLYYRIAARTISGPELLRIAADTTSDIQQAIDKTVSEAVMGALVKPIRAAMMGDDATIMAHYGRHVQSLMDINNLTEEEGIKRFRERTNKQMDEIEENIRNMSSVDLGRPLRDRMEEQRSTGTNQTTWTDPAFSSIRKMKTQKNNTIGDADEDDAIQDLAFNIIEGLQGKTKQNDKLEEAIRKAFIGDDPGVVKSLAQNSNGVSWDDINRWMVARLKNWGNEWSKRFFHHDRDKLRHIEGREDRGGDASSRNDEMVESKGERTQDEFGDKLESREPAPDQRMIDEEESRKPPPATARELFNDLIEDIKEGASRGTYKKIDANNYITLIKALSKSVQGNLDTFEHAVDKDGKPTEAKAMITEAIKHLPTSVQDKSYEYWVDVWRKFRLVAVELMEAIYGSQGNRMTDRERRLLNASTTTESDIMAIYIRRYASYYARNGVRRPI